MATHGLKRVWLALKDENQNIITGDNGLTQNGILELDSKYLGTQQANLSNMEGSSTKVYGDNAVQTVITSQGTPEVAFTFNHLPLEVKMKLSGYTEKTSNGGYYYADKKPTLACLIKTSTILDDANLFVGFPYGTMSFTSHNIQTDQDSPQITYDAGTFSALSANVLNGKMYAWYSDKSTGFTLAGVQKDVLGADGTTASTPGK